MSQSVSRALHLLVQLGNGPANLDQLAESTGVHKTTVLRLLRTLADERFMFRDNSNRYHLGSRIFELAAQASDQREVAAHRVTAPRRVQPRIRAHHAPRGDGRTATSCTSTNSNRTTRSGCTRESDCAPRSIPPRSPRCCSPTCRIRTAADRRPTGLLARTANTITTPNATCAEMPHGPRAGLGARSGGERAVHQLHRRRPSAARPAASSPPSPSRCPTSCSATTRSSTCCPFHRRRRGSPATADSARPTRPPYRKDDHSMTDCPRPVTARSAPAPQHTFSQGIEG